MQVLTTVGTVSAYVLTSMDRHSLTLPFIGISSKSINSDQVHAYF